MKRLFAWLFCIACLGAVSIAFAITDVEILNRAPYTIQDGDNLWNLAGTKLHDSRIWEQIVKDNPFLKQDGRRFVRDGKTIVILHKGEQLVGLEKLGIFPIVAPLATSPIVHMDEAILTWPWWLLVAALVLLLMGYLISRMLSKDAATARPAMVPGGVTDESARTHFQEAAALRHQETTGQSFPRQQFTIEEQTSGRIWGVLNVRYADGREVPRRLSGEQAYRARVRFPDQRIETLYMLQACGNDLRYGGVSRYLPGPKFRFEADTPSATEPTQVSAPEVPAAVVHPEVPTASTTNVKPGEVTFEYKPADDGQPHLVRLSGTEVQEFKCTVGPDGITVRYREKK